MEKNTALLQSDGSFDSGLLNQHIDIVRQITKPGEYKCTITKNQSEIFNLLIDVIDNHPELLAYIDLYSSTGVTRPERKIVATNGYLIFHSSWGSDKYRIKLGTEDELVMDSYSLSNEERIAITPFVPGIYKMADKGTGATGVIRVIDLANQSDRAIIESRASLMEQNPPQIKIEDGNFIPDEVTIQGDQPAIVIANKNTRVSGYRDNSNS